MCRSGDSRLRRLTRSLLSCSVARANRESKHWSRRPPRIVVWRQPATPLRTCWDSAGTPRGGRGDGGGGSLWSSSIQQDCCTLYFEKNIQIHVFAIIYALNNIPASHSYKLVYASAPSCISQGCEELGLPTHRVVPEPDPNFPGNEISCDTGTRP